MFNPETKKGLAPKSWTTVAVWLVLAAVFVSRPADSAEAFFGAVRGTGEWVGYNVFADCGDIPPMDWMETKACPTATGEADGPPADSQPVQPSQGPESGGEASGYAVTVDDESIRSLLDRGAETVTALHGEVEDIQANGGLIVEVGNPDRGGGGS